MLDFVFHGECNGEGEVFILRSPRIAASPISFVYGKSLWAELNGRENSLHWKANMLLYLVLWLCCYVWMVLVSPSSHLQQFGGCCRVKQPLGGASYRTCNLLALALMTTGEYGRVSYRVRSKSLAIFPYDLCQQYMLTSTKTTIRSIDHPSNLLQIYFYCWYND